MTMKMDQKGPNNFFKKPLKPHGTGILRLQVLNCLLEATTPIRAREIEQQLRTQGIRHDVDTIRQAVYEIAYALDGHLQLELTTVYGYPFKAVAYSISIKPQANNNA